MPCVAAVGDAGGIVDIASVGKAACPEMSEPPASPTTLREIEVQVLMLRNIISLTLLSYLESL